MRMLLSLPSAVKMLIALNTGYVWTSGKSSRTHLCEFDYVKRTGPPLLPLNDNPEIAVSRNAFEAKVIHHAHCILADLFIS